MALPEKWIAKCDGGWFEIIVTDRPGHCFRASWSQVRENKLQGHVTSPLVCKADMPEAIRERAIRSLIRLCTDAIQKYLGVPVERVSKVITSESVESGDAAAGWLEAEAIGPGLIPGENSA